MQPRLPDGARLSVPDLSKFGPQQPPMQQLLAVTVHPGDKVLILLPADAEKMEVVQIQEYLANWAPETQFLILVGPQSMAVIPAVKTIDVTPAPTEAEAPQGQKTFFEQVRDVKVSVAEANADYDVPGDEVLCVCAGPKEPHRFGSAICRNR